MTKRHQVSYKAQYMWLILVNKYLPDQESLKLIQNKLFWTIREIGDIICKETNKLRGAVNEKL